MVPHYKAQLKQEPSWNPNPFNLVHEKIGIWINKVYFILLFYFIILPHTMNYKQNKNDNK